MTLRRLHAFVLLAGLLCLVSSGCSSPSQDPQVLAIRNQYVAAAEPAGAVTLSELAQRLDGPADPSTAEPNTDDTAIATAAAAEPVVVIGRIYAGDLEPWDAGKASFLLAELPAEGHGEGHDADNCPFCKRRAAQAPTAIVQFLDDHGQLIAHDSRQLFDLKKNDVVTVRGQAIRGELNSLVLTADAIFVHRK